MTPTTPVTRPAYGQPDGHGRYGILDRDDDGRVLCHECGRWWWHLATHLAQRHGIRAADYRAAHGLSTGTALVGRRVREKLSAAWDADAERRGAQLAQVRNPDHARTRMTRAAQWAPELVAGRQARAAARRVDLTADQLAQLGDPTDIAAWADRARALIAHDGVPAAAIARATGLSTGAVHQRLRRYPPRP